MNKIQIKILVVLLTALIVVGSYSVFVVNKPPDPRFIPVAVFTPTERINPGNRVAALRGKVPNYNFNKRKKRSNEQAYPAPDDDKSSLPSVVGGVRSANSSPTVGSTYSYSTHSSKSIQTESGSSMQGMGALGLLASGKKSSGAANDGGSSSVSSSMASTTYDQGLTPNLQFAPDATIDINEFGNPGGDPDTPVGDGLWVILLLSVGYVIRRRNP